MGRSARLSQFLSGPLELLSLLVFMNLFKKTYSILDIANDSPQSYPAFALKLRGRNV
jgi:hypothetical protein